MAYGVIYKITNKLNGMPYIGQTINLEKRINQHKYGDLYIDRVIKKYGLDNFTIEVIEECETLEQLNEREIFWIATLNCKNPNGYNIANGGEGASGWTHTPEARAKMTAAQLGNKKCLGHHHTDKTRAKIAKSHKGRHHTAETCLKLSTSHRNETSYKNLLNELDKQQLTYTALAELMGLKVMTISDKMLGRYNFTEKDIAKLVEIFDKPADYLLARDDGLSIKLSKRGKTPYKNFSGRDEQTTTFVQRIGKAHELVEGFHFF